MNNLDLDNEELINYIIKLQIFCNNYYTYDLDYIKSKFNLDSFSNFRSLFKKKYKIKLLFNSLKSENLFINFINFDNEYFISRYKDNQINILLNFFICNQNLFFNKCNEISFSSNKNHADNCNCKIKVKSIVNLDIKTLLYILNNHNKNNNKSNVLKVHKNNNNIKLINNFNKLEQIGCLFGINNDIHYTLESSESCNLDDINDNNINYINNNNKNNNYNILDNRKIRKNNIYNENDDNNNSRSIQLDSELIDLNDEFKNIVVDNKINKELIESESESESSNNNEVYNELINNLDINNNILLDKLSYSDNINNLMLKIKDIIKLKNSDKFKLEYELLEKKINLINLIDNTDDMNEYFNIYKELVSFLKKI
jgi:hypothetical protein